VEEAMQIFQDMVTRGCERNVITYSSLITACEKSGKYQLALDFFNEMHRDNVKPNVVTYNALIAACGQGETMFPVLRLEAESSGSRPWNSRPWNSRTWKTGLKHSYCSWFPDVCFRTWTCSGMYEETGMENQEERQSSPQLRSAKAVRLTILHRRKLCNVSDFKALPTKSEIQSTIVEFGSWNPRLKHDLTMYRYKDNNISLRWEHAGGRKSKDVLAKYMSATIIVTIRWEGEMVTGGQWETAREIFDGMLSNNCKPDAITYGTLIAALDRGGQWGHALQVCPHYSSLFSIKAICLTVNIL